MDKIKQSLRPNEEILWQGEAVPKVGSKSILGELIVVAFGGGICWLIISIMISEYNDGELGIISILFYAIFILVGLLFAGLGIYSIIYKRTGLKDKMIAGKIYCVTNLRAFSYDPKKDKLKYGFLAKLKNISYIEGQTGYGDLELSTTDGADSEHTGGETIQKDDVDYINFENIANAQQVQKIINEAREKLAIKRPGDDVSADDSISDDSTADNSNDGDDSDNNNSTDML